MTHHDTPWDHGIVGRMLQADPRLLWLFRQVNILVRFLYRIRLAPLLGLGQIFVLLTTFGRKTGLPRTNPVEYHYFHTNRLSVISSRGKESSWVKNIQANNKVILQVGFYKIPTTAKIIDDPHVIFEHLMWYINQYAFLASQFLGIDFNTSQFQIWQTDSQGIKVPGQGYKNLMELAERIVVVQFMVGNPSKA